MNFFKIAETTEQHGSTYRASLFVDNDRKEAFLSFAKDGILVAVNYPVRYEFGIDEGHLKK